MEEFVRKKDAGKFEKRMRYKKGFSGKRNVRVEKFRDSENLTFSMKRNTLLNDFWLTVFRRTRNAAWLKEI
jgi:hypothetical protein